MERLLHLRENYFTYDECTNISGIDCNLSIAGIKNILKDMTGKDCSVTKNYQKQKRLYRS